MKVIVAGANAAISTPVIDISVTHGGQRIEHAVAVIPLSGPDSPWLPLQEPAPYYAPRGDGPTSYSIDLSRLHPSADRLQLVLQTGSDASMLHALGWVRAAVGEYEIQLDAKDLRVSCVVFAELYRKDGGWKLRAKRDGVVNGIAELGRRYGKSIEDKTKSPLPPPAPGHANPPAPVQGRGEEWGGSAFLVADGYLITNAHVVAGAGQVLVTGFGGRYDAGPVVVDHTNDLALIRIDRFGAQTPLSFRPSGPILGEQATSIGFPLAGVLGSGVKLGEGIVSGMLGPEDDVRAFQITSPIQPGSSGGPVVDMFGHVIGIATASFMGAQNVNLALRANLAASLMEAANVPVRWGAPESRQLSMSQIARDCSPLVWRLECRA